MSAGQPVQQVDPYSCKCGCIPQALSARQRVAFCKHGSWQTGTAAMHLSSCHHQKATGGPAAPPGLCTPPAAPRKDNLSLAGNYKALSPQMSAGLLRQLQSSGRRTAAAA